jgi:hypothetical protein
MACVGKRVTCILYPMLKCLVVVFSLQTCIKFSRLVNIEVFWDIMTQRNILGDLNVQHRRVNFKSRNDLSVLLAKCLVLEDAEQFQLVLVFGGRCRH